MSEFKVGDQVRVKDNASFLEYEDALKTFHNAVEEIVNK